MNTGAPASSADEGVLATLRGLLPAGWRERLAELFDFDPTQATWLGEESTRVGANLLLLLERGWPEMLALGGRLALSAFAGALLVGMAAAVLGWVLYLLVAGPLLRRGWKTGRLIGCFAATTVILLAGAAGGWAGMWLGASRTIERAIEKEYIVERLAAATFLAATIGAEEYPQRVDPEAVDELLTRAQSRSAASWAGFRSKAEKAADDAGLEQPSWMSAELMVAAIERISGEGGPSLLALHRVLSGPDDRDGDDPLPQTAEIRKRAVGLLRANVYTQTATSLGLGLGLPLVGLVLFGLLGCFVNRSTAIDRQDLGARNE